MIINLHQIETSYINVCDTALGMQKVVPRYSDSFIDHGHSQYNKVASIVRVKAHCLLGPRSFPHNILQSFGTASNEKY